MKSVISIVCLTVLLICAIQDLRLRMVNIVIPVLLMILITGIRILYYKENIAGIVFAAIPGIIMLLISVFGNEILGFADGVIVGFVGVCEEFYFAALIVLLSFALSWLIIIYMIIIKHHGINEIVIPLAPCIMLAWMCVHIGRWLI